MKRFLFAFALSFQLFGYTQTTVVEEKIEGKIQPFNFQVFDNEEQFVVFYGNRIIAGPSGGEVNLINSFSSKGEKKVIAENIKVTNYKFSLSHNTLKANDFSKGYNKQKVVYLNDGKFTSPIEYEDKDYEFYQYFGRVNFNDTYEFRLKNQNDKPDIDFQKDNIKLQVTDINTRKSEVFNLVKPSVDRLVGSSFIELEKELGFKFKINRDDKTLDLITKSISKDYTKTILYKTSYLYNGKVASETSFELKLPNNVFLYSYNGGGDIDFTAKGRRYFNEDLSINNYYEDPSNGDVYIYGLFGNELAKLNTNANPSGYYIFKFDKNGKKIWETINKVDDKHFNTNHSLTSTEVNLSIINNNLCFSVFINENKEYVAYGLVEKQFGKVIKSNIIVFHQEMTNFSMTNSYFLKYIYEFEDIKELKNKKFNINTMIAMDLNPKVSEYIKKLKSKRELHFCTIFTEKLTWLIETDNKDYYKVTLF